jgi:4-hydroxy-3-polyprenylbenzoate decarboxylase
MCLPGVLAIQAPAYAKDDAEAERFCQSIQPGAIADSWPLLVLVDASDFTARTLDNFLWVTFTRSNPAADVGGIGSFVRQKHWGCEGPLVIDARIKPHHAPALEEDPAVSRRVDALAAPGKALHGII